MKVVVVYDISDDGRRLKLAESLFRLGLNRIQRSAFAGDLDTQKFKDLVRISMKYAKTERDVIHIFSLGLRDWEKRLVIGREWGSRGDAESTLLIH